MTDKYKKYKETVNIPQEWIKGGFKAVKNWKPDNNLWQLGRVPVATVAFNLYLLSWLITKLGFENSLIEKIEDNNTKKKLNTKSDSFFNRAINAIKRQKKKSPTASAFIAYYLMLLSLMGGGKLAYNIHHKNKEIVKEKKLTPQNKQDKISFKEFCEPLKPVTPWLIADLIAKEGVKLDENGLHKPYQDSKGIWTIGYGSTVLKDGTKVTAKTKHMTDEEAYELARWHIEEYETYPLLYWYYVYDNNLLLGTFNEAVGMGSIFYNTANGLVENKSNKNNKERFTILRKYMEEYGIDNIPDDLILECFNQYPVTDAQSFGKAWLEHQDSRQMANTLVNFCKDGGGLYWRRWLEAGLLTGDITPQDLLECPANCLSDFLDYMGGWTKNNADRKNALWEQTEIGWTPKKGSYAAFKQWLLNPKRKDKKGNESVITGRKVIDFLPDEIAKLLSDPENKATGKLKYKHKSKVIAFNDAIMKIKERQKQSKSTFVYNFNNDYTA